MITLTQRQLAVLNHIVVDGRAWVDRDVNFHIGKGMTRQEAEDHTTKGLEAKVSRHASSYDAAVAEGNYRNRVQRDADEASEELTRWAADVATARAKRIKELNHLVCLQYQVHIDPHYLKQNRRGRREASPYTIPDSVEAFEDGLEALTYKADIASLNTVQEIKDYNIVLPPFPVV